MQQPIYGENGEIVDYYDDGSPEEHPPEQAPGVSPAQQKAPHPLPPPELPPTEEPVEPAVGVSYSWRVPAILQGTNDLFVGVTAHHDDGNPQGPLVSVFVREVPDGAIKTHFYRAAELSQRAFLDDIQKAIAATMQSYLLDWADRQRKKLEEEAKRKARQATASARIPTPAKPAATTQPVATAQPAASKPPLPTKEPTRTPPPAPPKKNPPKYVTTSMFE